MLMLGAQTLGVVAGGTLLVALLQGAGLRISLARGVALAVLAFLGVLAVTSLHDGWHRLDEQRARNAHHTRASARGACIGPTLADPEYLAWVRTRVPPHATYRISNPALHRGPTSICMQFLLMPRLHTKDVNRAQFILFPGVIRPEFLEVIRRRGGKWERLRRGYALVRFP
jgi:hypothetical protein